MRIAVTCRSSTPDRRSSRTTCVTPGKVENNNKLITVPWDAAKFDPEKKTATVNVTQEAWTTIPTYTVTTYPQFYTSTYRTDIYKVYGLAPRELRRIERRIP